MSRFTFVELFAGIGGVSFGFERVGGECLLAAEYDPEREGKRQYAQDSYRALHPSTPVVGDVFKLDAKDVPDHDVLSFTTTCQSFSVAGKRGGFDDVRGTLYFEAMRIAAAKAPRVIFMENVKGLVGHDKSKTLDTIVKVANECGYRVDFNVLNSKYFGVPQNRERFFMIGVREDLIENEAWTNTKGSLVVPKGKRRISGYDDVKTFNFDWPGQEEVTTRLIDVLETKVDERYYLSEEKTTALVAQLDEKDKADTPNVVHNIYGGFKESKPRVFKDVSPTIRTAAGGGHLPSLLEKGLPIREATATGYAVAEEGDAVNFRFPNSKTRRGRVGKQMANTLEASGISQGVVESHSMDASLREGCTKIREDGVSSAITATYHKGVGNQERPFVGEEVRPVLTPDRLKKRQNGRRFKEDGEESFTLTGQDRHGVALGKERELNGGEKERDTVKVLRVLQEEIGEETFAEWRFRILDSLQSSEILQHGMYEETSGDKLSTLVFGEQQSEERPFKSRIFYRLTDLSEVWLGQEFRRSPHRWEPLQQFARELSITMSELSQQNPQTRKIMQDLWETTEGSRLLQQALYKVQEIWRSDVQKTRYRIRKLSPKECFRLQGFSDEAHQTLVDAGISNTQLYKQSGNAVTVNVIEALGQRLLTYL